MLTGWLTFTAFLAASANPRRAASGRSALTFGPNCRITCQPEVEVTLDCGDGKITGVVQYWHTPFGGLHNPGLQNRSEPVFMRRDGTLVIPNASVLHSGLYYCLLQHEGGTTLWPYELHVDQDEHEQIRCAALRSRRSPEAAEEKPAGVSDGLFAGVVVASVLLTFLLGFCSGALSRSYVLRCFGSVAAKLQSRKQRRSDTPDHISHITMATMRNNQSPEAEDTSSSLPTMETTPSAPAKPQRSFRHKRGEEEHGAAYLEGCDYIREDEDESREEDDEDESREKDEHENREEDEHENREEDDEDESREKDEDESREEDDVDESREKDEDKSREKDEHENREEDDEDESREKDEDESREEDVEDETREKDEHESREEDDEDESREKDEHESREEDDEDESREKDEKKNTEEKDEGESREKDGEKSREEKDETTRGEEDEEQSTSEFKETKTCREVDTDAGSSKSEEPPSAPPRGRRSRVIRLYQYDEDGQRYGHLRDSAAEAPEPPPRLKQRSLSLTRLNAIMAAASAGPMDQREAEREGSEEATQFHLEI